MESSYIIQAITAKRVDQAYALVRLVRPQLSLDSWRDLCRGGAAPAGSAARATLLMLNPAGYIRGLCTYRIERASPSACALRVDMLAFAHPIAPEAILDRLMAELDSVGTSNGCQYIDIDADDLGPWRARACAGRRLPVRLRRSIHGPATGAAQPR